MLPRLCLLIGAASAVLGMVVQPVHKLPTAGIAMHHQPQPLLSTPMVQPLLTPSSVVADEPRFRVLPSGEVMALEGENPAEKGKAAEPTATPEHSAAAKAGEHEKCTEGKEYSKIFKKCLPRVGTDGYTPSADASASAAGDKKGKLIGDSRVFQDPDQVAALHEQPIIRNAALTAGQQAPGQQAPGQQAPGQQQPPQQLRLACPSGFVYQPNMGTCIAFRPTSALAARGRDGDNDDDGNDDNDDDRRGAMTERGGDEDRRSRLFGRSGRFMFHHRDESPFFHGRRRFGFGPRSFRPRFMGSFRGESPSILAPVFVFVLPPMKLDREGKQRIHHIHPSFVGPADKKADATVIPKGKEMETKPAQPPITPEAPTKVEDKGKAAPAAPPTPKPSEPSTPTTPPAKPIESKPTVVPAALRQAEFINPIVGGGDMSTATSMAAPTSDEQPAKLSERVSSDQML